MNAGQKNATIAGSMSIEDHLGKLLKRTGPVPMKCSDNKLLPRPQHSPFGDFPASHMPSKKGPVANPGVLSAQEQSVAAGQTAKGKSNIHYYTNHCLVTDELRIQLSARASRADSAYAVAIFCSLSCKLAKTVTRKHYFCAQLSDRAGALT